jgi:hypothetical protein
MAEGWPNARTDKIVRVAPHTSFFKMFPLNCTLYGGVRQDEGKRVAGYKVILDRTDKVHESFARKE